MGKFLLALILAVFVAGWSFAQTETEMEMEAEAQTETVVETKSAPTERMPMNTITVDIGPTMYGLAFGLAGVLLDEPGINTSGFGIAAQYERQIVDKFSLAGRFSYLGTGVGVVTTTEDGKAVAEMRFTAFSVEGHARFYPWAETFYVDGMLGYANMSTTISGLVSYKDTNDITRRETIAFTASRNYFEFGAKVGWRIDFGRPGGFVFEPSFGWYGGIGVGDTLGKKLSDDINKKLLSEGGEGDADMSETDEMFKLLENFVFVGGPRFSLSFGWRF